MLKLNAYSEWDKIEFPNYKQDFSKWGLQFTLGKEKNIVRTPLITMMISRK